MVTKIIRAMKVPVRGRESGFSIISAMAALSVLSIYIVVWMHYTVAAQKELSIIQSRTDLELLRRRFFAELDCQKTVSNPVCDDPAEQDVDLVHINSVGADDIIVPSGGGDLEKLHVRATCMRSATPGEISLKIYVSQLRSGPQKFSDRVLDVGCNSVSTENYQATCTALGGAWDPSLKCQMPSEGLHIKPKLDDSIPREKVLSCDTKETGSGSDVKTCDRVNFASEARSNCVFKPGIGWVWKTANAPNSYKICEGGVYVDMSP